MVVHHVSVEAVVVPDLLNVLSFEELPECVKNRNNLALHGGRYYQSSNLEVLIFTTTGEAAQSTFKYKLTILAR